MRTTSDTNEVFVASVSALVGLHFTVCWFDDGCEGGKEMGDFKIDFSGAVCGCDGTDEGLDAAAECCTTLFPSFLAPFPMMWCSQSNDFIILQNIE
jgi:hypothetical protein